MHTSCWRPVAKSLLYPLMAPKQSCLKVNHSGSAILGSSLQTLHRRGCIKKVQEQSGLQARLVRCSDITLSILSTTWSWIWTSQELNKSLTLHTYTSLSQNQCLVQRLLAAPSKSRRRQSSRMDTEIFQWKETRAWLSEWCRETILVRRRQVCCAKASKTRWFNLCSLK